MTLPLPLRNRVAELAVEAFHDASARRQLRALAAVCTGAGTRDDELAVVEAASGDLFERRDGRLVMKPAWRLHAAEMAERSLRAHEAAARRPLDPPDVPLDVALAQAAALFDAGLYFEVHELLEPHWLRSEGVARQAVQGLIQIAVAFHHLSNDNLAGARALLRDGVAKIAGRALAGRDLDAFARAAGTCLADSSRPIGQSPPGFDWGTVPRFPIS